MCVMPSFEYSITQIFDSYSPSVDILFKIPTFVFHRRKFEMGE